MVNVGIIGLGTLWETRYQAAFQTLKNRIRICSVYDPIAGRAKQVAQELKASAVTGMLALAQQSDVQAILLIDADQQRESLLSALCDVGKPIFIAGSLQSEAAQLGQLYATALEEGRTLMPEFVLRYTPATRRLQELLATRLGNTRKIRIDVEGVPFLEEERATNNLLIGLFDWCRYVVRRPPINVHAQVTDSVQSIQVAYQQPKQGGENPVAELHFHRGASGDDDAGPRLRFQIGADQGEATIESSEQIRWDTGEERGEELLTEEGAATEVMLDHFCRRVVGGLIPIPDLADICRGIELVNAVQASLRTGSKVLPDGELFVG